METEYARKIPKSWADMEVGNEVQLLEQGRIHFAGKVDAMTHDGTVVWLTSSVGERRLFHVEDGYLPSQARAQTPA